MDFVSRLKADQVPPRIAITALLVNTTLMQNNLRGRISGSEVFTVTITANFQE